MNLDRNYDIRIQQVWLEAWCNVARADNCTDTGAPTRWADKCLADFKERFKRPANEGNDNG